MKKTKSYLIAISAVFFALFSTKANAQQAPLSASFTMNTSQICQGGSIQFTNTSTGPISEQRWTFNGSQTYNWFEPNPPAISFPFWNGGGFIVSLYIESLSGESSYFETYITVWPSPTIEIVGDNHATICSSDSALFIASTNAENPTFHWRAYDGDLDVTIASDSIFLHEEGGYEVTVIDERGCTGETWGASVSVHDPITISWNGDFPNIDQEEDTIETCETDYTSWLYVNADNVYGNYYSSVTWSNGQNGSSMRIDSTHMYVVTIDDGENVCGVVTDSIYILVHPKPIPEIISNPIGIEFCEGDIVELSTGSEYSDIEWTYTSLSTQFSAQTETFNPEESGTYKVSVTDQFGCRGSQSSPFISINPRPDKPQIVVADGCSLAASSAQVGTTYLYKWYLQNEEILGASEQYFTASTEGFYTVETMYVQNGCASISDPVYAMCDPSGIETLEGTALAAYPNPFTDRFVVPNSELAVVTLVDMFGKVVSTQSSNTNIVFENISASAGMYQLIVDNGTSRKTMKMVKQ